MQTKTVLKIKTFSSSKQLDGARDAGRIRGGQAGGDAGRGRRAGTLGGDDVGDVAAAPGWRLRAIRK